MHRTALVGAAVAALAHGPAQSAARGADLEGLWSLGTYTEIERPRELKNLVLTAAEAEAFEAPRRALGGMAPSKDGELGQPESEFNDRGKGLARVRGQIRSSWITDPATGQVPYRPEALRRLPKLAPAERNYDGPEALTQADRCLVSPAAGPPMFGAADGNLVQILPTSQATVILTEKFHDARIVELDRSPAGRRPPSLAGWSVGHFEGRTLVIESGGFQPGLTLRFQRIFVSDKTRVTERLSRLGPRELLYEFVVSDDDLYLQPWRGEMTLQAADGRMFEYACHEGNYAVANMLGGARRVEREAAEPAKTR